MFSVYTQDKIDEKKDKDKAAVVVMRGLAADPLKSERNWGKNIQLWNENLISWLFNFTDKRDELSKKYKDRMDGFVKRMINRPTQYKNYNYVLQHEHRDDMNRDLS